MNSTNTSALMRLGALAVNSGHDEQTVRYFREALNLDPKVVGVNVRRGLMLRNYPPV
jgi:hypothetical protein